MKLGVQFEVIYKTKELIQVRVIAWNGSFGGTADIYMGVGGLQEIAAKLKGFPSSVSDSRVITLGAFGPKSEGGANMRFYCADASGHAYVESRIESGSLSGGSVQTVTLSLPVESAAVDSFVNELHQLGLNSGGIASLAGLPGAAT